MSRIPELPEMIIIPAGDFLYGEEPPRSQYLPAYQISRYPVTVGQFKRFVRETHYECSPRALQAPDDHPVNHVSVADAEAYCAWLSKTTGQSVTLPSEAEWEKAARGTDGRTYPWGNIWEAHRCTNAMNPSPVEGMPTTPVDAHPNGESPYGVRDLSGNVWEWTRDAWK